MTNNNALQTIRRPAAYYAHLIPAEMAAAAQRPPAVQALLADNEARPAQRTRTRARART